MHHIIYLSQATARFTDAQLPALLQEARQRNAELEVSGILLYGQGQFLRLLEGAASTLQDLYAGIRRDPRPRDVITYADKEVPGRAFAGWAMAYHPLAPVQFQQFVGLPHPNELQNERPGLTQADQYSLHLLRAFVLPE